jgi:hypothetical protein
MEKEELQPPVCAVNPTTPPLQAVAGSGTSITNARIVFASPEDERSVLRTEIEEGESVPPCPAQGHILIIARLIPIHALGGRHCTAH